MALLQTSHHTLLRGTSGVVELAPRLRQGSVRRSLLEPCLTSPYLREPMVAHAPCQLPSRASQVQRLVCHASHTASTIDATAYSQPGPVATTELETITVTVGGDAELPITAQIRVTVPRGATRGPRPLVLLSAGFLLNASLYNSYATHLASWGYPAVLYDLSEVMDDMDTVRAIRKILDTCQGWSKLKSHWASEQGVVLVGHSRGGKLSCLTAAQDSNVKGLILFDPVDNTPMTPAGEGYPSALTGLVRTTSSPRNLPVLVVGAGSGGDVVPDNANYKRFAAACQGPVWKCDLTGAGHLAFLDKQIGLFSLFSAAGATPDDAVRSASKVAMMTWLEHAIAPLRPPTITCAAALHAAEHAMRGIVRNALTTDHSSLSLLPNAPREAGSSSSSSSHSHGHEHGHGNGHSRGRSQSHGGVGGSSPRHPPVTDTYEELMKRRAKELKAMLVERGVPCADCFEKEMLAKRLLETCGAKR